MRYFLLFCVACSLASTSRAQFGALHTVNETWADLPSAVKCMDVDGDGDQDILVASDGNNELNFFANDGTGAFAPPVLIATYPGICSIHPVDLDGDGDLDLVIGGVSETYIDSLAANPKLTAWLENLGGGLFGPPQQISGMDGGTILDVGDIDGDGDVDVLAGLEYDLGAGRIAWYANNGNGVFGTAQVLVDTMQHLGTVRLGDLDGNGTLDVVASDLGNGIEPRKIYWYQNSGNGIFTPPQTVIQQTYLQGQFTIADVDLDGDMDIGVSSPYQSAFTWYLNDASGAFPTHIYAATGAQDQGTPAVSDVNNDGYPDLLLGSMGESTPSLCLNSGTGTFGNGIQLPAGSLDLHYGVSMDAADLNGDQIPDIVVAYSIPRTVGVFFQDSAGGFGRPLLINSQSIAEMSLRDMNGDGLADWVGTSDTRVTWYPRLPDGTWGKQQILVGRGASGPFCLIDADNDGDLDCVYGGVYARLALNGGDGWYGQLTTICSTGGLDPYSCLRIGDLDNDGDLDIVAAEEQGAALYWYENHGDGTPFTKHLIANAVSAFEIRLADLNGDGNLDVIYMSSIGDNKLAWFPNEGSGNLGPRQVISTGGSDTETLITGDLDGDGDQDIVRSALAIGMIWFVNDGSGNFVPDTIPVAGMGTAMDMVDLDGDGWQDLLVAKQLQHNLYWLRNQGGATSFQTVTIATLPDAIGSIHAEDVDGDGDPDVMIYSGSTYSSWCGWLENLSPHPYGAEGTIFADLNGNGVQDGTEPPFPYAGIQVQPQGGYLLSNSDGGYSYTGADTACTLSAFSSWPWWQVSSSPSNYALAFGGNDSLYTGLNFGLAPVNDTLVMSGDYIAIAPKCHGTSAQRILLHNIGASLTDVHVVAHVDTAFTILSCTPSADSLVNGTAYWSIPSLSSLGQIDLHIALQNPGPEFAGDTIRSLATVHAHGVDGVDQQVFLDSIVAPLNCSYDPNYKEVQPTGYGPAGAVPVTTEKLTYTIHFQNTGTDTAYQVMILDQLDPSLDASSVEVLASSHPLTSIAVSGSGSLEFHFDGIQLPDSGADQLGSQGFVSYSVELGPDATHGTVITNSASIYFDQNLPVQTNETVNTLVDCSFFHATLTWSGIDQFQASNGVHFQWFIDGIAIPGATDQQFSFTNAGIYSVEITNTYGCVSQSDPFDMTSTNIATSDQNTLQLFPDPTAGDLTLLSSEEISVNSEIEFIDSSGRKVRSWRGQGDHMIHLACGDLADGLYMVRVYDPRTGLSMTARVLLR